MRQKWYHKASVQSAFINSFPNLGILIIAIFTVVITLNISKNQRSYNQANFDKQFSRDSVLSIQQDSITKQQTLLANLQLDILNKQFKNDSIDNFRQLLISEENFNLNAKKRIQSDLMNNENLAIENIEFKTYETKYQNEPLDSVYQFTPDIIYKMNKANVVNKNFQLLYRLTLYDPKLDSELINLPVLQTFPDIVKYIGRHHVSNNFKILKKFTFICNIKNNTQFPIKLLSDSLSNLTLPYADDLFASYKSNRGTSIATNNIIVYPNEKASVSSSFMFSVNWQLNREFYIQFSLSYVTIFGKKSKEIKAVYIPRDKDFLIYN